MSEFELKFQVPPDRRAEVEAALANGPVTRRRLQARYFDTPQGALERHGMVLRLRKEGPEWVQTVKRAADEGSFERLEHNAPAAPGGAVDVALHDDSPAGTPLRDALSGSGEDETALQPVFTTDVVRLARVYASGQTEVEVALDRGRVAAGGREVPVLELEFELKGGMPSTLIELAQEWCARYGLWIDPLSKSMVGRRLAAQKTVGSAKTASPVTAKRHASTQQLLDAVLGSVLDQVLWNGREVAAGHGSDRHVHQLRVGLRRLRSVLREMHGLSELSSLPDGVEECLTALFRRLGEHRDALVLVPQVEQQLAAAGAPPVKADRPSAPDVGAAVRDLAFQSALLEVIALRHRLQEHAADAPTTRKVLRRTVSKRLARLYGQSLKGGGDFAQLPEPERHRIRKRLKRLRYLGELMRPLYAPRKVDRFVDALKGLQDTLGEYQDAAVGRRLWRERAQEEPEALFGAGWLSAREEELARSCERACRRAVKKAQVFWE